MNFGSLGGVIRIDVEVGTCVETTGPSDDGEAGWPGQDERRRVKTGTGKYARWYVGVSHPNTNVSLTGGRAESIAISPVTLSWTQVC